MTALTLSIAAALAALPLPETVLPPAPRWSGASERLVARAGDPWITPAERAGFRTTPTYAETRAWLERLDAASPLVSIEPFGRTGEGRDLLLVRASSGPGPAGPKPVVLVQAGIHAGEIDGKDAGLMLLRDIALRGKRGLLDHVDLVFVPIYNIDGHERPSAWHFPALRGPAEKGVVANARGINLNRDYAKADAPETRAMIALLRRLDPILYIDCHVSDGFDMGYDTTFTYAGWGRYAYHHATADWLTTRFGPRVTAALALAGEDASRIAAARAADRAGRPKTMLVRWRPSPTPIGWIEDFRGIAVETYRSPASGRPEQRWTGRPVSWRMPIIGQEPVETVTLPKAWWIPRTQAEVIDRLRLHGIRFTAVDHPVTLELDRVRLRDPVVQRAQDGRLPLKATFDHATVTETLPAGSIRVAADQPLGLLAAALLEPEAPDSFLAWGFFPEMLAAPPTTEDFVAAPLADALLAADGAIRGAFAAKLAADPAFAADPDARFAWLADHLPGRSPHYLTYPIRRER